MRQPETEQAEPPMPVDPVPRLLGDERRGDSDPIGAVTLHPSPNQRDSERHEEQPHTSEREGESDAMVRHSNLSRIDAARTRG